MKRLLIFSTISLLLFSSCDDKKYKNMPLDTILNYPGAVVLAEDRMFSEANKIIAIRIKTESRYEVKEIKIPGSEGWIIDVGDTIKLEGNNIDSEIKNYYNSYETFSKSESITSINNCKGGIVIDKDIDDVTFTSCRYYLTIKRKEGFTENWKIYNIRVVESEYRSVEIGDTIN